MKGKDNTKKRNQIEEAKSKGCLSCSFLSFCTKTPSVDTRYSIFWNEFVFTLTFFPFYFLAKLAYRLKSPLRALLDSDSRIAFKKVKEFSSMLEVNNCDVTSSSQKQGRIFSFFSTVYRWLCYLKSILYLQIA